MPLLNSSTTTQSSSTTNPTNVMTKTTISKATQSASLQQTILAQASSYPEYGYNSEPLPEYTLEQAASGQTLSDVPVPVTFSDVCSRICDAGYNRPVAMLPQSEQIPVNVAEKPSEYRVGQGGLIHVQVYTIEGQLTGKGEVGGNRGMQIDVYRRLPETVAFRAAPGAAELRSIMTPRRLGFNVGDTLLMEDKLRGEPELISGDTRQLHPCGPSLEVVIDLHVLVMTTDHKSIRVICDIAKTTVSQLKARVYELTSCDDILDYYGVKLEDMSKSLRDYGVGSGETIVMVKKIQVVVPAAGSGYYAPPGCVPVTSGYYGAPMSQRADYGSEFSGFAAGGKISQKINRDSLPVTAYDPESGERLYVHVLNAAYFQSITGLPAPPSPIDTQTYLTLGLPLYQIFDEQIPRANNAARGAAQALAGVKSIAQLDKERSTQGKPVQQECVFCQYQMATTRLIPCGHVVCDDCAEGLEPRACPECPQFVRAREKFAAPMVMPGQEENDGVTLDHIRTDQHTGNVVSVGAAVVILKRHAGASVVLSSKRVGTQVSSLHGFNI